jgi:hypothetical protein
LQGESILKHFEFCIWAFLLWDFHTLMLSSKV